MCTSTKNLNELYQLSRLQGRYYTNPPKNCEAFNVSSWSHSQKLWIVIKIKMWDVWVTHYDSHMVCFSCFKWFCVDSTLGNIKYQHITQKKSRHFIMGEKRQGKWHRPDGTFVLNEREASLPIFCTFILCKKQLGKVILLMDEAVHFF